MASFPGSVKSFATRSAGQTIQPAHVNDIQDEVNAIEDGYINGTAHLNSSHSTVAALSVSGGSTLASLTVSGGSTLASLSVSGGSTLASTITIGALPYIFPASGGSTGHVLTIDSTSGSTMTLKWAAAAAATSVPAAVKLGIDTAQEIAANSTVVVSWTRQDFATNSSMHSTAVNPDRVTPQSSGLYMCIAQLFYRTGAGQQLAVTVLDSSGARIAAGEGSTLTGSKLVTAIGMKYFDSVAGSTQWMRVEAYSGTSTNSLSSVVGLSHFSVVKLG